MMRRVLPPQRKALSVWTCRALGFHVLDLVICISLGPEVESRVCSYGWREVGAAVLLKENLASQPCRGNRSVGVAALGRAFLRFWLAATFLVCFHLLLPGLLLGEDQKPEETEVALADLVGGPLCAEHHCV